MEKPKTPSIQLFVVVIGLCIIVAVADHDQVPTSCPILKKLDVLPGRGWDNLRNKEMGQVQSVTYTNCKTTPDGLYVIPDDVSIIPIKQSEVQLYSNIIESWKNYTSVTSKSINLNADPSFGFAYSISASFSDDYQTMKKQQSDLKSVTTRMQARYTLYTVTYPTNKAKLDTHLQSMLQKAIVAIKRHDANMVDYLLELVIREYGTHLLTRMDAGAVLVQDDYVSRDYANSLSGNASAQLIKAAASARFFTKFGFSSSYITSVNETIMAGYEQSVRSSTTDTFGGLLLHSTNTSIDDWIDSIPNNLIAVDREGDPLHFIVTPAAFPNESLSTVDTLRLEVQQAIIRYYTYNKHFGCMEVGSRNFDYNANIEDDVCKDPSSNYTFGGVYQTCQVESDEVGNHCKVYNLTKKNFLTQDYSCPQPYLPVPLITLSTVKQCEQACSGWWLWESCNPICSQSNYTTYWCAAVGTGSDLKENSGLMFGGVFTPKMDNPMTKDKSCPPTFIEVTVLNGLTICVGNDMEHGARFAVDFGGLFSCQQGNPLYNAVENRKRKIGLGVSGSTGFDGQTIKACPEGFTQHTAIIYEDCLVSYCAKAGSFRLHGEMPVILPPFKNYTGLFSQIVKSLSDSNEGSMSALGIASIVIFALLLVIFVGILGFKMGIRKQNGYEIMSRGNGGGVFA